MKLFYAPGACSLSPHIVLRECGYDFTLVKVDFANKKTEKGEDYLKINPKGQVPALQLDEGDILTEGPAIVQYLADLKPDRKLLAPVGSLTRYHTIAWLNYVSSELHKAFGPLFHAADPEEDKEKARKVLKTKYHDVVEPALKKKEWIAGQHFSVADIYLFVVTRWAKKMRVFNLDELDALKKWMQAISERPSVKAAIDAENSV